MENNISQLIIEHLTDEEINAAIRSASSEISGMKEALVKRTEQMEHKELYQQLIDYAVSSTEDYLSNPETIRKVLSDSKNIEIPFAEITESEIFKELAKEDYRGMPRILVVSVICFGESAVVSSAASIIPDLKDEEKEYLDALYAKYQSYVKDAVNYGLGGKNVAIH